jgi:hypothetical protein
MTFLTLLDEQAVGLLRGLGPHSDLPSSYRPGVEAPAHVEVHP